MAQVVLQMQAAGFMGVETCTGCGKEFVRGERMNAVEAKDGTPLGWYCESCIGQWLNVHQPGQLRCFDDA